MVTVDNAHVEYAWYYPPPRRMPLKGERAPLVFLHHGYGCVANWKDFPRAVADATQRPALVYSRRGCGASSPVPTKRTPRYLHEEGQEFLPSLLDALDISECHLFGHSDGATIALLFASAYPERVLPSVIEAPHVFAEDVTLQGAAATTARYKTDEEFRGRVSRYHADPDGAFFAWSQIWLSPEFTSWAIVDELQTIGTRLLVLQGDSDPYGTFAHADLIAANVATPPTVVKLAGCGHSPHVEQAADVCRLTADFLNSSL